MADLKAVINDPDFASLPRQEQMKVLDAVDADFAGLPLPEKHRVMDGLRPASETSNWKGTASRIARPILEGAGAAVGSILGATGGSFVAPGPGSVAGGVAGAAGGYAIGSQAADLADEYLGVNDIGSIQEQAMRIPGRLAEGAAMEMGGQIVGAGIGAAGKGLNYVYNGVKNAAPVMTSKQAEKAVATTLRKSSSGMPEYAANEQVARELEEKIPGLRFSRGQATGDPEAIKLERSMVRAPGEAARVYDAQKRSNMGAIDAYLGKTFAGDVDNVVRPMAAQGDELERRALQEAGELSSAVAGRVSGNTVDTNTALRQRAGVLKNATRKEVKALYDALSDSNVPTDRVLGEAIDIKYNTSPELAGEVPPVVDDIIRLYSGEYAPYSETLAAEAKMLKDADYGNFIINGHRANRSWSAAQDWFKKLPQGVSRERAINALNRAAGGKQLDDVDRQIVNAAIDDVARRPGGEGILDAKIEIPLRRVIDLRSRLNQELRTAQAQGDARAEASISKLLQSVNSTIDDLGASGSMYDDAQRFAEANSAYRNEIVERFRKGAGGSLLRKNPRGEYAVSDDKIHTLFFKPGDAGVSAAREFKKVFKGDKEATNYMKQAINNDLYEKVVSRESGEIVPAKVTGWFNAHQKALRELGVDGEYKSVQEIAKQLEKTAVERVAYQRSAAAKFLNADPERAFSSALQGSFNIGAKASELLKAVGSDRAAKEGLKTGFVDFLVKSAKTSNGDITSAGINRVFRKYSPAIRTIFQDDKAGLQALMNVRKAYETMDRTNRSPIGYGSDTAENIASMLVKQFGGKSVQAVRFLTNILGQYGDKKANEYLIRATFDPAFAKTIDRAAKGADRESLYSTISLQMAGLGGTKASAAGKSATVSATNLLQDKRQGQK